MSIPSPGSSISQPPHSPYANSSMTESPPPAYSPSDDGHGPMGDNSMDTIPHGVSAVPFQVIFSLQTLLYLIRVHALLFLASFIPSCRICF